MDSLGQQGVLQVIPEAQLQAQDAARAAAQAAAQQPPTDMSGLAGYIRGQFEIFRNHRNTASGWSQRLLYALETYNGQYTSSKIQVIRRFGGSEAYFRTTTKRCRAATSLLRDIYLSGERPWALEPPTDPEIDPSVLQQIDQLMQQEGQMLQQTGVHADPHDILQRRKALIESAKQAAVRNATQQCRDSEDKIEQLLRDGGFYQALAEFLVDLPIFPHACIKGPVVRLKPTIIWQGNNPVVKMKPTLWWYRVSPFDLWWSPGAQDISQADVIEKVRVTRAELNDLLDLPGYNRNEVLAVLEQYGRGGLYDNWDTTDAERAVLESRENPAWNRSAMISMLCYTGNVQGRLLQDYGLPAPDELRDYHIEAWLIGEHVIKAHFSPSPRLRHPYFITSYEKVPGTPVGNGLTDLLSDIQEGTNATARAMFNNLAMASGPQVVINDDRLTPEENPEEMFPWKRWHTRSDPVGNNSQKPIDFFQPNSNAQEAMQVIQWLEQMADDVSAVPKYVGGQASGGAGRTASGLAMLMGNASKILQTVSANIDRDVIEPLLQQLLDLIRLTDTTGLLTGEEKVYVRGVQVVMQRETERQRQMEALQATNNPTDMHLIGIEGRGKLLRKVLDGIVPGEDIVPDDQKLDQLQQQQERQQQLGPLTQKVQEGVATGVRQGLARITADLTAGGLAQQLGIPEGPPVHEGVVPGQPGQPGAGGGGGLGGAAPANVPAGAGPVAANAGKAQGNQPSPLSTKDQGPQTRVVGSPSQSPVMGQGPPIRGGV